MINITQTESEVFGNKIISGLNNYKEVELETLTASVSFSKDEIIICHNPITALPLVGNKLRDELVNKLIEAQLQCLYKAIKREVSTSRTFEEVYHVLSTAFTPSELCSGIKAHTLAEWAWLTIEDTQDILMFGEGNYRQATLVKYMNYIFSPEFLAKIRTLL